MPEPMCDSAFESILRAMRREGRVDEADALALDRAALRDLLADATAHAGDFAAECGRLQAELAEAKARGMEDNSRAEWLLTSDEAMTIIKQAGWSTPERTRALQAELADAKGRATDFAMDCQRLQVEAATVHQALQRVNERIAAMCKLCGKTVSKACAACPLVAMQEGGEIQWWDAVDAHLEADAQREKQLAVCDRAFSKLTVQLRYSFAEMALLWDELHRLSPDNAILHHSAKATREHVEADARRDTACQAAAEALSDVEYVAGDEVMRCPYCERRRGQGHIEGCEVHKALATLAAAGYGEGNA